MRGPCRKDSSQKDYFSLGNQCFECCWTPGSKEELRQEKVLSCDQVVPSASGRCQPLQEQKTNGMVPKWMKNVQVMDVCDSGHACCFILYCPDVLLENWPLDDVAQCSYTVGSNVLDQRSMLKTHILTMHGFPAWGKSHRDHCKYLTDSVLKWTWVNGLYMWMTSGKIMKPILGCCPQKRRVRFVVFKASCWVRWMEQCKRCMTMVDILNWLSHYEIGHPIGDQQSGVNTGINEAKWISEQKNRRAGGGVVASSDCHSCFQPPISHAHESCLPVMGNGEAVR